MKKKLVVIKTSFDALLLDNVKQKIVLNSKIGKQPDASLSAHLMIAVCSDFIDAVVSYPFMCTALFARSMLLNASVTQENTQEKMQRKRQISFLGVRDLTEMV